MLNVISFYFMQNDYSVQFENVNDITKLHHLLLLKTATLLVKMLNIEQWILLTEGDVKVVTERTE